MYYTTQLSTDFTTGDPERSWTQRNWHAVVIPDYGFQLFVVEKGVNLPVAIFIHKDNLPRNLHFPAAIADHLQFVSDGVPHNLSYSQIAAYGQRALQEIMRVSENSIRLSF